MCIVIAVVAIIAIKLSFPLRAVQLLKAIPFVAGVSTSTSLSPPSPCRRPQFPPRGKLIHLTYLAGMFGAPSIYMPAPVLSSGQQCRHKSPAFMWLGSRLMKLLPHFGKIPTSHCSCLFFFFNWRTITLQYCGGFCHTSTWISHGCTCAPSSLTPPSFHLPPHPIPLGCPRAPVPVLDGSCFMGCCFFPQCCFLNLWF